MQHHFFWVKSYPYNIRWDGSRWSGPLFDYLDTTCQHFPNRPAFNFMGKKWRWDSISHLVNKMAKALHDHGAEKGIKVGICLPNCPYYLIAYYAIAKTGATIVNFNPLYAERELAHQIEDSQTDLLITFDLKIAYDKIEKMLQTTRLNQIVSRGSSQPFHF